jgi:hypothetical protein
MSSAIRSFCITLGATVLAVLLVTPPWADAQGTDPDSRDKFDWADDNRPKCSIEQKENCKTQCKHEFDAKYHTCMSSCLEPQCDPTQPPTNSRASRGKDEDTGCLQIESSFCSDQCKASHDIDPARCRRACLANRCPGSRRSDISKEAIDPGASRCDICKKQAEKTCSDSCDAGISNRRAGMAAGVSMYACQEMCQRLTCQSDCL